MARTLAEKSAEGSLTLARAVDLFDLLFDFKKSSATGETIGFKRGADGETNGFVGAAFVGNHQVSVEGVEISFDAFNGSVETFEVDAGVEPV